MKRVKNSRNYFYQKELKGYSIYLFDVVYKLIQQVGKFSEVVEFVRAKGGL